MFSEDERKLSVWSFKTDKRSMSSSYFMHPVHKMTSYLVSWKETQANPSTRDTVDGVAWFSG